MQREAVNFGIQSTVADSMSCALINLFNYRKQNNHLKYKIVLSVHDAIILLCPFDQINVVTKEVLPYCMCTNLEVPEIKLHYTLGDIDIQKRWGENLSKDEVSQLCVV
jgi:DNA polymerase I-like protein with 3'-5' exonuclease and polymerase domains